MEQPGPAVISGEQLETERSQFPLLGSKMWLSEHTVTRVCQVLCDDSEGNGLRTEERERCFFLEKWSQSTVGKACALSVPGHPEARSV